MFLFGNVGFKFRVKHLRHTGCVGIIVVRMDHKCDDIYPISKKTSANSFGSVVSFKIDMSNHFLKFVSSLKRNFK